MQNFILLLLMFSVSTILCVLFFWNECEEITQDISCKFNMYPSGMDGEQLFCLLSASRKAFSCARKTLLQN